MACWRPYKDITKIEDEFVSFYCDIIIEIYNEKTMIRWYQRCTEALSIIKNMKPDMNNKEKKHYYNYLNFREPVIRFAYVYYFSIINTCTTYQHFLNFFNKNVDFHRILNTKSSIRICCLGGGPGVEAVAICKIINDFFKGVYSNSSLTEIARDCSTSQVLVQLTIFDICDEWQRDAFAIMNAMKGSSILDSKRVKVETNFIHADLLHPVKGYLQEELKKADIVTLVRTGNEIIQKEPEKLSALCGNLRTIVKLMKVDSCLFVQDSAELAFSHLKDSVCSSTVTEVESYEDRVYSLSPDSYAKFRNIPLEELVARFPPVCDSKTSSCVWVNKNTSHENEIKSNYTYEKF